MYGQPRTCLIGHSGFVGSNLAARHSFTTLYRSSNIDEIQGQEFEQLVCAGAPAEKWKANQQPDKDRANIERLVGNLRQTKAASAVLVSTVDVYPVIRDADESYDCRSMPNHAYGTNRLYLEEAFREIFPEACIVRLPGVFGPGLKKNVIYDLIHDNCLDAINPESIFQYYDVSCLWDDLQIVLGAHLPVINLVTEPIATHEIASRFFPQTQIGPGKNPAAHYDLQTNYSELFGGTGRYRFSAADILSQLGSYIQSTAKGAAA